MPDIKPIPPIPNIPTNKVNDHYRIGYDSTNGATTLTLIADYTSMTLSLGPEEVMRLIRMLGATLDDEDIIGNMHDGFCMAKVMTIIRHPHQDHRRACFQ